MKKLFAVIILCASFSQGLCAVKKDYDYDSQKVTAEQMEVFKEILTVRPDEAVNIKWMNRDSDDWSVKNYFIHTETYTYQADKKFGCFDIQFNSPSWETVTHWLCTEINYNGEFIRPVTKETIWLQSRSYGKFLGKPVAGERTMEMTFIRVK